MLAFVFFLYCNKIPLIKIDGLQVLKCDEFILQTSNLLVLDTTKSSSSVQIIELKIPVKSDLKFNDPAGNTGLGERTFRFWHCTGERVVGLCDKHLDTVGCIADQAPQQEGAPASNPPGWPDCALHLETSGKAAAAAAVADGALA